MEKHDRIEIAGERPLRGGSLLILGLWMRLAIAGAAFAAAGVASLFDPGRGVSLPAALAWIVAGGAFAWFARRRAVALLDGPDRNPSPRIDRDDASPLPPAARAPAPS